MADPTGAKCRIFVVDDHVLIRHGVAMLIGAEADMEVCGQAEDSAAALEGILKLQPDVVIVDISLKGNSGIELIKNIKAHSPKIQILVLSMHHESVYALRALKAGARGYVMKQDVIHKIVEGIRRLRRGHLCVSDEIAGQMLNRFMGAAASEEISLVDSLSDRELEIVNLIGNGLSTREIAVKLHVSVKTVETHRAHIKEKLNLQNATQLVQTCVRWVEENVAGKSAAALSRGSAARGGEEHASAPMAQAPAAHTLDLDGHAPDFGAREGSSIPGSSRQLSGSKGLRQYEARVPST